MRLLNVPVCLALLCLPAVAQEQGPQELQGRNPQALEKTTQIGGGVLCDTREQMIRFVALRDDGKEAPTALRTVNEEAQNVSACNLVMVMFSTRKVIGEMTLHGKIVSLVEITVHAFGDGHVWKRTPEAVRQYTLVPEKGQNV